MNAFYVIAGWTRPERKIGTCHIEAARGKEVISFSFDRAWIAENPGFMLDPDLSLVTGRQYPPDNKTCFGFLADIAPDRWGRKLMDRRERLDAAADNRNVRKLRESDYILGVHDRGRMGGIRLQSVEDGSMLSDRETLAAPPMEQLRKLEQASLAMEQNRESAEEKWFRDLLEPGSSLGGARPKANVLDENGHMWIAKFPSRGDEINAGAWETVIHELAFLAGITVPHARRAHLSGAGDTFLVKRFDRSNDERIHFASAMTMLGMTDNSDVTSDYTDIAGVLEQIGARPESDLQALWMRAAFSVCVSNADNHLRNHGFLLTKEGWRLSPAYDMNPAYDRDHMALTICGDDRMRLQSVLDAAPYFRLDRTEANARAETIRKIVRENWKKLAKKHGIGAKEQALMKHAFSEAN